MLQGGRTAWSATVTVENKNIAARYWYDGQYLNNAKEDAAEVATTSMRNPSITSRANISGWNGEAREEEKVEPEDEPMPEGAIARVGEEILD